MIKKLYNYFFTDKDYANTYLKSGYYAIHTKAREIYFGITDKDTVKMLHNKKQIDVDDTSSQVVLTNPNYSGYVSSILSHLDGGIHLSSNVYYDGSDWVSGVAGESSSVVRFRKDGASWFASTDYEANGFDTVVNRTLWDASGVIQAPLSDSIQTESGNDVMQMGVTNYSPYNSTTTIRQDQANFDGSAYTFTLDTNVSGSTPYTATRYRRSLHIDMASSDTGGNTTNREYIYGAYITSSGQGSQYGVIGVETRAYANSASGYIPTVTGGLFRGYITQTGTDTLYGYGSQSFCNINSTGNVNTAYGSFSQVVTSAGITGNVTNLAQGANNQVQHNSSNLIPSVYGSYNLVDLNNDGGASVASGVRSYISKASTAPLATGHLFFGQYTETLPTNAYGIYLVDNNFTNYMGGNTQIVRQLTANSTSYTHTISNHTFEPDRIELNMNGSGDRYSYIDFHSDDTNTDYSARIIRNQGVNGSLQISNQGTGEIIFNQTCRWNRGEYLYVQPADQLMSNTGGVGTLQVFANNSYDAFMTFHVSGDYACHFGLDHATNELSVGGWSMGANIYPILHSGRWDTNTGIKATGVKMRVSGTTLYIRNDGTAA